MMLRATAFLGLLVVISCYSFSANPDLYVTANGVTQQLTNLYNSGTKFQELYCYANDKTTFYNYYRFGPDQAKVKILLVCGLHARELFSIDACLDFLKKNGGSLDPNTRLDVFLWPNENREAVLKGNYLIRKDKQGVDLNRNYDIEWEQGDPNFDNDTYRGPKPMSEPFSQCADSLLAKQNYTAVIDIHTGLFMLYFDANPNTTKYNNSRELLTGVQKSLCPYCKVSTLQENGENRTGQLHVYASRKRNVQYGILLEIYSSASNSAKMSDNNRYFKRFNPNSAQVKQFYTDKWINIIKMITDEITKKKIDSDSPFKTKI